MTDLKTSSTAATRDFVATLLQLMLMMLLSSTFVFGASRIAIVAESERSGPVKHGLTRLQTALESKGVSVTNDASAVADAYLIAGLSSSSNAATATLRAMKVELPQAREGLAIRRATYRGKPAVVLCGSDPRGLMYAALDTSVRVSWAEDLTKPFEHVRDTDEKPDLAQRGVSMYTMQRAYFESRLYDEEHWKRYFDMLASDRINNFVIIFGYENGGFMAPPYPYFFNVESYPDVELVGLTPEQQARNTAAFHAMMRIAHERGVDITAAIWDHIYRGGVQGGGIPGASENAGKRVSGLVWGLTSDNLATYTKAALRKFLQVFPEIDGLEFRMHAESGLKPSEMEVFWHEVFGILKQQRPGLRVLLRAKELPDTIIADAQNQGLPTRVETKFWMEQMGMPFHPTHLNRQNQHDRRHGYADLLHYPQTYQVHWRLWNGGTTRLLLWADPEYVRRFAASAHLYNGDSLEVNEMLATRMLGEPHTEPVLPILNPRYKYYDYEFERYWHFYQVWGRLSYNPQTPPEVWERDFSRRFGSAGSELMQALHLASNVLPRIVAASYRYQLFPTTRGWAEMMRQDDLPKFADMDGSDIEQFMSARDEARSILDGTDTGLRRPEETSRWFAGTADRVLKLAQRAEATAGQQPGPEMLSTLTDVKILAHLAQYHAARLNGAVHYNLYKQTGDLFAFDDAVADERAALSAWEEIVKAAGDVYSKQLAFGPHAVGFSRHWSEELQKLRRGLDELIAERKGAQLRPAGNQPRIAHVPVRRSAPQHPIRIRASVASQVPLKQVSVLVSNDGGSFKSHPMRESAPGLYQIEVAGKGALRYRIEAIDTTGIRSVYPKPADGDSIKVAVTTDREPPQVTLQPVSLAKPGVKLVITASAQDPSGVRSVRLKYRHLNQYEDYRVIDMTRDSKTGSYAGVIPGDFITPKWDLMYFVEAIDTPGNGRNYPDLDTRTPYVVIPVDHSDVSAIAARP